jgi:hypothetical protein
MTGQECVALLMARLGGRRGIEANVVLELNEAQTKKLEKTTFFPWFLQVDTNIAGTNLVTVVNREYVDLPADFLGFDEEQGGLFYNDASAGADPWVPVPKDSYPFFKERYRDPQASAAQATGAPAVFDIIGTRLYVRPIPDAVYSLRLLYMQKQAAIANDGTTNKWLEHASDWLMGEAGIMLGGFQHQNSELGSGFAAMAVAGRTRAYHETIVRIENARMVSQGED